jgi:hypothetical protein
MEPHELDCGLKVSSKDDTRWTEWHDSETFFGEVRQMVERRLRLGESQADIRRLLRVSDPEDHPSLMESNPDLPSTTSPLSHPISPHEETSSALSSTDIMTTQMTQWANNEPPMKYPTLPIRPSTPGFSISNSTPFQPQFLPPGVFSEGYLPSAAGIGQPFTNPSTDDIWFPDNLNQQSFDGNISLQSQWWPLEDLEIFDPSATSGDQT